MPFRKRMTNAAKTIFPLSQEHRECFRTSHHAKEYTSCHTFLRLLRFLHLMEKKLHTITVLRKFRRTLQKSFCFREMTDANVYIRKITKSPWIAFVQIECTLERYHSLQPFSRRKKRPSKTSQNFRIIRLQTIGGTQALHRTLPLSCLHCDATQNILAGKALLIETDGMLGRGPCSLEPIKTQFVIGNFFQCRYIGWLFEEQFFQKNKSFAMLPQKLMLLCAFEQFMCRY